jgi:hypothetical protein
MHGLLTAIRSSIGSLEKSAQYSLCRREDCQAATTDFSLLIEAVHIMIAPQVLAEADEQTEEHLAVSSCVRSCPFHGL